jgi:hypothetical protein
VIFPRLYLWDEPQEDPLSPGVILPIPQMTAAKEEEFAFLHKTRSLTRERTRTRRAPNGSQIRRPSEPKDFLDRHSNSWNDANIFEGTENEVRNCLMPKNTEVAEWGSFICLT